MKTTMGVRCTCASVFSPATEESMRTSFGAVEELEEEDEEDDEEDEEELEDDEDEEEEPYHVDPLLPAIVVRNLRL